MNWSPLLPVGDPFGRHVNMATHGRLYELGMAAMFQIFGVTLWAARLYSLVGWALAGLLTYRLGVRYYGRVMGIGGALLFATATKSLLTAHTARPETWTTATILLATLAALRLVQTTEGHSDFGSLGSAFTGKVKANSAVILASKDRSETSEVLFERHWLYTVLVGILAVLPGDFHGNGFTFTFAIGVALGIELGLRQRRWLQLAGVGLGAGLGVLAWVGLHLGLNLVEIGQLAVYTIFSGSGRGLIANVVAMVEWLRLAFWVAGGPVSLLELGLAILGCGSALYRRSQVDRMLTTIALAALAAFGAFFSQRFVQYAVLWSPFWFVLGVAALADLARRVARRWPDHRDVQTSGTQTSEVSETLSPAKQEPVVSRLWRGGFAQRLPKSYFVHLALFLVIGGMVAVQLAGDLWLIYRFRGGRYDQTAAALGALVPEGTRVVADMTWWWTLREGRMYIADEYFFLLNQTEDPNVQRFLGLREAVSPPEALPALLQLLQPDHIVLDRATGCYQTPRPEWQAVAAYVQEHCQTVGQVSGAWVDDPGKRTSQFAQVSVVYACQMP